MANSEVVNVSEYEELAKQKLPKMVYDYYASGAEDQWTLKENRSAFERIRCVAARTHLLSVGSTLNCSFWLQAKPKCSVLWQGRICIRFF